jgi:hypothetical protein
MFATRLLFPPPCSPDAPAGEAAPARPAVAPATVDRRAQSLTDRLIARHGDVISALASLATTNITQEDTIDTLTRANADYKAKLPEGSVVIPAAEAKNFDKLRALGSVDDIVKGWSEYQTLKTEKTDRETREAAKTLAKAAGADEEAFAEHYTGKGLKGEVRNVETVESGKKVTKAVLYVQPGEKEPYVSWPDYVAKLPAYEQRALTPGAPTAPTTPGSTGVAFPAPGVSPAPGTAGEDPVSRYMAQRNAQPSRPNPILGPRPQQPATPAGAAS